MAENILIDEHFGSVVSDELYGEKRRKKSVKKNPDFIIYFGSEEFIVGLDEPNIYSKIIGGSKHVGTSFVFFKGFV